MVQSNFSLNPSFQDSNLFVDAHAVPFMSNPAENPDDRISRYATQIHVASKKTRFTGYDAKTYQRTMLFYRFLVVVLAFLCNPGN